MNTKLHRNIASRVVTSLLLFKSHQESWDEIYSVVTTHSYLGNVTASPGVLVHVDAVQRDEKNIDDDVNPKGEVWEIFLSFYDVVAGLAAVAEFIAVFSSSRGVPERGAGGRRTKKKKERGLVFVVHDIRRSHTSV